MAVVTSAVRGTPFKEATEAEIAWVGGLFEGEGCVSATKKASGNRYITVRVVIRELEVLERLMSIVGVGAVYFRAAPSGERYANYSDTYEWAINAHSDAVDFLDGIWPWLSERRRQQIMLAEEAVNGR